LAAPGVFGAIVVVVPERSQSETLFESTTGGASLREMLRPAVLPLFGFGDPVHTQSAGLAFTLTLVDELTEGELTGGRNIAVTGTHRYVKVGVSTTLKIRVAHPSYAPKTVTIGTLEEGTTKLLTTPITLSP